MFQRAAPAESDAALSNIYGLAMPLVKAGIPVEPVQLENALQHNALQPFRLLLLTYEGQKPLRAEYHEALVRWVRRGGSLLVLDDGADPYHHVRAWWNDEGRTRETPLDDLVATLRSRGRRGPETRARGQRPCPDAS